MTPGKELVRVRRRNDNSREYRLQFRHPVFAGEVIIRRDRRGHLIYKLDSQPVGLKDLPEAVQELYGALDFEALSYLWLHDDTVEVRSRTAAAWDNGKLSQLIKTKLLEIGEPLKRAA